jgi:hypothetical protein
MLFLGDSKGGQVFAVQTDAKEAKAGFKSKIEGIGGKIAGRIGTTAENIEIADLAVHPVSHVAFVAVRSKGKTLLMTVNGEGEIAEYPLENVKYARLKLPAAENKIITRVTDLAWAGNRLLVSGLSTEQFASKIFIIKGPLTHEASAAAHSAETYHVAHRQWETRAPMTVLMPYEEDGKQYLAGSFACTPVVKYPLDDLKAGEKVKGVSMIELGSGNRPLNMFSYEKGGKKYVLMNTFRMFHARKPFGPSPYWTVRFERDLLAGNDPEKVNQKALWRINTKFEPITDRIKLIEDYHGVVHMDKLDGERALTLKQEGKKDFTLVAIALP